MPSRTAPEWFGGGASNLTSPRSKSSSRNGSNGKRSHRRSTSLDGSGLNLSNHSSKSEKKSSRKKHQRRKSRDVLELSGGSSDSKTNGNKNAILQERGLVAPVTPTDQQQQPQHQKDSLPRNSEKAEGRVEQTQTDNSTVDTSPSSPFTRRTSLMERILGFKPSFRSEPEPTSAPTVDNIASEEQRLLPEKNTPLTTDNLDVNGNSKYNNEYGNNNSNVAFPHPHHHKLSHQASGLSQHTTTQHNNVSMRIPQEPYHNPLQYHLQDQNQHSYQYQRKYENGMQDVYRNHKPSPILGRGPCIEHCATYPPPITNPYDHNGAFQSGTESDDLFMYSEDESMTAPSMPSYPMQYGMNTNPFPYGTYAYEGYKNRESVEVREHQQMMALAPTNHHITSFAPASMVGVGESKYGSFADRVPGAGAGAAGVHTHSPNDLYISEDETINTMRRASFSSVDGLGSYASSVYGSTNTMVIEEGDEEGEEAEAKVDDAQMASISTIQPTTNHLRHREEGANAGQNTSNKLSRTYSDGTDANTSNSGSGSGSAGSKARSVTIKTVPTNYSSGSSTGSSKRVRHHHQQYSPTPKRQSPPPPISSVKVHKIHNRNFSSETSTTASTSVPSPHKTGANIPKLTRKEYKKLTKRLEAAEDREDKVQNIIRSGHVDLLNWSMHVPQNIRGISRAAGFFPDGEIKLHDFPFAILFLIQLGVVISLAISYAGETVMSGSSVASSSSVYENEPFGINTYNDDPFGVPLENWAKDIHVEYKNFIQLSCITALYATSLSVISTGMMMILGKALIPTVLCLCVIICIGFGTIGTVLSPYSCIPIVGLLALVLSLGYSVVVWERIPFASTNLNTALCGVKSGAHVFLVAFVMMVLAFMWTIGWAIASLGVYDHYLDKNSESGVNNSITWYGICIFVGMCISYFWTINVMTNIVHVTIAGVVATWWADPDSLSTLCNNVLQDLFTKSLTTSFGSICLGSLVVPPLDFLKTASSFCCDSYTTSHRTRDAADLSSHGKIGDCVSEASSPITNLPIPTSPFDDVIRYFNDYGFTYVGIYREGFSTSSRKATDVFKAREWVGVSSDRLVPNVLAMISFMITLGSGCFGLVVEEFDGYSFTNFQKPTSTAFLIGCWIGFVISRILLKVVGSAVNTVLVCFSLAPWTFKVNHPVLSHEMRSSWGGTWLDEYEWMNNMERGEAVMR